MEAMEINRPEIIEEVSALCADYERALVANDVTALQGYFWDSSLALRFGATEELYGAEEINAFRKARVVNFGDRTVVRETLLVLGETFAVSTIEFTVTVNGSPRHGRQSQVWARFPDLGWRIVSAHVSHRVAPSTQSAFSVSAAGSFGGAASDFLDLPVNPAFRDNVVANLESIAKMAKPLMELDLPEVEPAARFIP